MALQNSRPEWLELAFDDSDLQRVVEAWERLPAAMRQAIVAIANVRELKTACEERPSASWTEPAGHRRQ